MTKYIFGMHDTGGEYLMADKPGYIVISEAIGYDRNDHSGRDYRHLSNAGYGVLVRLNNAHNGVDGTIPAPGHYSEFAQRCANFARNSQGVAAYIIGNEPNHAQERPHGDAIWPQMYADCFNMCYAEMKGKRVDDIQVLPAPIAPWDATTKYPTNPNGDWVVYFSDVQGAIPFCDGLVLHTYTHGAGIHLITSEAHMNPPFAHRHYEFRAYRDFLAAVPKGKRGLPVYITETDQIDPWVNANIGWVQAAYGEINAWNEQQGTQKIHCLCLYRWSKDDKWSISDKPGVHQDFQAAIGRGYTSPVTGQNVMTEQTTHLPYIPNEAPSTTPTLPPREWDERLTQRGVTVETPDVAPGQQYWRVKAAQWFDEKQAGGRHHIYVNAPDGTPFRVDWPSGSAGGKASGRGGFDAGNFSMSASLNEFSVRIDDGKPSETVRGIGMGANKNPGIHTSTGVTFELATMPQSTKPPASTPGKPTATAYVLAPAGANLRAAPKNGSVIIAVPYGEKVLITGVEQDGWLRVRYGEHEGYMAAHLVGMEPPAPSTPPSPPPSEPPQPTPAGVIEPRILQAILNVESGGRSHGLDNRPIIRFEAHVFKDMLKNDALWSQHFRTDPNQPWVNQEWRRSANAPWEPIHTGNQGNEYAALEFAKGIDPEAAHKSISMGAAQIMGFHHARIGYPSAQAMFKAFQDASMQTIGFINYFLSDPALMDAARRKDWSEVARRYNGSGQVELYSGLLQKAYDALA